MFELITFSPVFDPSKVSVVGRPLPFVRVKVGALKVSVAAVLVALLMNDNVPLVLERVWGCKLLLKTCALVTPAAMLIEPPWER